MEFLPGQLVTKMPLADAAVTSMVSNPAPARSTMVSFLALSNTLAGTLVERTISTSGSISAIAAGRVSGERSGLTVTAQPRLRRPSTPVLSNLSAIRILRVISVEATAGRGGGKPVRVGVL